ncbi:uncharacterized protein JCM6883_001413 [Sporobolomyces salmoneus]|uniref:uncharacterized protein n=1 Tax=Sporobolomyces salmoneus TaxID=183962 RepID=UPI00317CD5A2
MDRLPFELLIHIANCLSFEPVPQLRQTSLSYLSRTNKTLLLATRPILYRDPELLSDWRAQIYENSLSKNVNPWLLSRVNKVDKQWWMPRSDSNARSVPSFIPCQHDVVWSNLTSFHILDPAYSANFSTHLLGPGRDLRKTIESLDLYGAYYSFYPFLFDAVHYIDASLFLVEDAKKGVDWPTDNDDTDLQDWERPRGGQRDPEAWEWVNAGPKFLQRARFDYSTWEEHLDDDALWALDYSSLPTLIHSRSPSQFPFSSLTLLKITCTTLLDYMLIFYTPSFPALRTLSLYADCSLTEKEILEYPFKPYRGPNLRRLELW